MKRRLAPQARADDDIILDAEPLSNLAIEFARLTGRCDFAQLDDSQIARLRSYCCEVAKHDHNGQLILVLSDDWLQRLVVIQNPRAPHFAFFPN